MSNDLQICCLSIVLNPDELLNDARVCIPKLLPNGRVGVDVSAAGLRILHALDLITTFLRTSLRSHSKPRAGIRVCTATLRATNHPQQLRCRLASTTQTCHLGARASCIKVQRSNLRWVGHLKGWKDRPPVSVIELGKLRGHSPQVPSIKILAYQQVSGSCSHRLRPLSFKLLGRSLKHNSRVVVLEGISSHCLLNWKTLAGGKTFGTSAHQHLCVLVHAHDESMISTTILHFHRLHVYG
mmetsp:Transcript_1085/g.2779  ORF Transcript_1085/g.2779 Transcript_1085/m.2779 type:complete len:240 (+) Transcript_1085:545-1264(+)